MRKNTLWNKIFHEKDVRANAKEKAFLQGRLENTDQIERFQKGIAEATSLLTLLVLHKQIYGQGYRNSGIGPDKYGMFRCATIATMKASDVYLGNIYGLWTYNINQWEEYKRTNPDSYKRVLKQYADQLSLNLTAIIKDYERKLENYIQHGY